MGEKSKISWTQATFNPWWGCGEIGPGCDNCYAREWAKKAGYSDAWSGQYRHFGEAHWNEPRKWNRKAEKEKRRLKVFCASMADWADLRVPDELRLKLWSLIRETPWLDWQLLTKRIGNVPKMLPQDWDEGWPNVWMGMTVVNQEETDRDVPKLLKIEARIRWLSIEPLLGPIDLGKAHPCGYYCDPNVPSENPLWGHHDHDFWTPGINTAIKWIIVGGESGLYARPAHPDWVRSIRDQCQAAGVSFFFKQWGEWGPSNAEVRNSLTDRIKLSNDIISRVGKKTAGRILDGREWNEYPDLK